MADEQDAPKFIEQSVVDAMLDELKTSMQLTIDMLTQRNVNYRAAMKRLEMHGTDLEAQLLAERDVIKPSLLAEIRKLKGEGE